MKKTYFNHVIYRTILKHIVLVGGLGICIVVTLLLNILPPLLLERGINLLVYGQSMPWLIAIGYFGILACSGLFESIREALITIFGEKALHELRSEMSHKMTRLPSQYFVEHDAGELTSLFVGDVSTIETLFHSGVISMIVDAGTTISIIVIVFSRSLGLGILLCIMAPILMYLTRSFQKKMLVSHKKNREAIAKAGEVIPETLHNQKTIVNLNVEDFMVHRYNKLIDKSYAAIEQANFYDSIYSPIIIVLSALLIGIMMVLTASGIRFQNLFGMSVGTAAALISYVNQVFTPLENIGMEIQNIQSAMAGISRINAYLGQEEKEKHDAKQIQDINEVIQVNHLTFGYDKHEMILHDFSMQVDKGEVVTLTGRTGAGKSTIFKLLLGLYPCGSGEVKVFGVSPEQIDDKQKRSICACVEQSFHPVLGTIKDQITLHDSTVTDCEVQQALITVGLYQLVQDLPEKENTMFTEKLFSQGQLQLLNVARAIVKNPKILLLDEMTADLDAITEKQIQDAILQQGRTILSISHRTYAMNQNRQIHLQN